MAEAQEAADDEVDVTSEDRLPASDPSFHSGTVTAN